MLGRTHLSAGILTGEIVVLASGKTDTTSAIILIATAAVGSLLPDIDHPQSMLSSSNRISQNVSESISAVTQHRGFTHTLAFIALILFGLFLLINPYTAYTNTVLVGILAGFLSHMVLDTLNEKGIMWFWPLSAHHIHIMKIRTGSRWESFVRWLCNVAATVCLGYILYIQYSPIWRSLHARLF